MALPSLYVNDQDVESLGLRVTSLTGPWDVPDVTDVTVGIPGRAGLALAGGPIQLAARTIAIVAQIYESSGVRTNADLLAKIEVLRSLFATGVLEVRTSNQATRAYFARLARFQVVPNGPSVAATSAQCTIALTCNDPTGYELSPSVAAFGANRVAIPLGSAPSGGLIRIMGPATNPVLSCRDMRGTVVHTIGLTRSLLSTDYEEIDLDLLKITRVQSGVATDDIAALTSGDFEAFALSPEDGDPANNAWPSLECSGLSSGGGCEYTYWKAYL